MDAVRLPQGTIRYRDSGSGEPLLFVHGLLVNGRLWDLAVERLQGDYRCIVPDLPLGSHLEPMNEDADLSPPGIARIVAELIESLDLDGVTLVGNDSGGAISQIVATRHPDRIGRLVLTNCDTYDNFPPKLFSYLILAAKVPGALGMLSQSLRFRPLRRSPLAYGVLTKSRLDSELMEAWVLPGIESAEIRRDTRKFLNGASPKQTLEAARELESFTAPTLFAWAPEDRWFPVDHAERLSEAMPNARLERIEDSKTFVSIDQPERLAAAIATFMRETKPVAA
jgi:pimeloyl-ACP methyl ester carboxylesterase